MPDPPIPGLRCRWCPHDWHARRCDCGCASSSAYLRKHAHEEDDHA